MTPRFEDDAILARLVPEVRRLGRLPTNDELRMLRRADPTLPSLTVFARYGPKHGLAAKLVEYCAERADLADVAELVLPLIGDEPVDDAAAPDSVEFGFVYLLRSGRNYKLGRSNAFGRRERELAIQLPERAGTVHVIRTDDPAGIEAYWHRRFADRRGNGEWFRLTADDVAAFRRRKFM